jgi:hypothetical protein
MIDPISMSVAGLAYLAPKIAGWLGGEKAEDAVQAVANVTRQVAGVNDVPEAVRAIQANPDMALKFQQLIADRETQFDRLYLQDRQDARKMYQEQHDTADVIADRVMKHNVAYVVLVLAGQCLAMWLLREETEILSAVSMTSGWIVKGLLDERREVTGFYFGSSLGSRIKDK